MGSENHVATKERTVFRVNFRSGCEDHKKGSISQKVKSELTENSKKKKKKAVSLKEHSKVLIKELSLPFE